MRRIVFILILMLGVALPGFRHPVFAAAMQDRCNGVWRIDVERTFGVNETWRQVYENRGVEDRAATLRMWRSKEITIDFASHSIDEKVDGKPNRYWSITEVHHKGEGLGMKVRVKDGEPHDVSMTPQDEDTLLLVIEDKTSIILARKKSEGW